MAGVQFNPVNAQVGGGGGGAPATPQLGLNVIGGGGGMQPVRQGKDWYNPGDMQMPGVMPEFLNDIFAPALEARKQEREFQGWTDAINGMTVEEVRKDAPWYTKIFGPNHYESGVVMYEGMKKQSDLASEWLAKMPELRQLPQEQVTRMLSDRMKQDLTGDPFVDSVMQKSMMQQFAPLIQQHTKERVAWQNTEMLRVQVDAAQAQQSVYQQSARAAAMLGKDHPMQAEVTQGLEASRASLRERWQVGRYQTDESAKAFINTTLSSAIRNGEFYVVEAALADGVLDHMSPEDAERFQKSYAAGAARYQTQFSEDNPEFAKQIAMLNSAKHFGLGGEEMGRMVDDVNQTWQAMTGSRLPWYDLEKKASLQEAATTSALRSYERYEDKLFAIQQRESGELAKAEAERRNDDRIIGSFQGGSMGEALTMKHLEKGDADRATMAYFMNKVQESPEQAVGMLIWNQNNPKGSYVNEQLATQLQNNVQNNLDPEGTASDGFIAQYNVWQSMFMGRGFSAQDGKMVEGTAAQGRATAVAYYGDAMNAKMLQFHEKVSAGMAQDRAYATTFGLNAEGTRADFRSDTTEQTKARSKAFLAGLDKMDAGLFDRTFGNGFKLHPSARAALARDAGSRYAQIDGSAYGEGNEGIQAQAAMNLVLQGKAELIGGFYLTRNRNQESLSAYMGDTMDKERSSLLFREVLDGKLKERGFSTDGSAVFIDRLNDEGGVPVFAVHVESDSGSSVVDIRGTDLLGAEAAHISAVEAENKRIGKVRQANKESQVQRTDSGIPLGATLVAPDQSKRAREAYHGMSDEEFDERGRRNRAKIGRALMWMANPLGTAIIQSNED